MDTTIVATAVALAGLGVGLFARLRQDIHRLDGRLDIPEQRSAAVERRAATVDERLAALERRIGAIEDRMAAIEG